MIDEVNLKTTKKDIDIFWKWRLFTKNSKNLHSLLYYYVAFPNFQEVLLDLVKFEDHPMLLFYTYDWQSNAENHKNS
mgnify:CR=1 FL=1